MHVASMMPKSIPPTTFTRSRVFRSVQFMRSLCVHSILLPFSEDHSLAEVHLVLLFGSLLQLGLHGLDRESLGGHLLVDPQRQLVGSLDREAHVPPAGLLCVRQHPLLAL